MFKDVVKTHVEPTTPEDIPELSQYKNQIVGRSILVKSYRVLPIESIVRGYITGSGWKEYCKSGTVHGISMPKGLVESQVLETPIWTPSTKADEGHDENISPEKATELIGEKYAAEMERLSLLIYKKVFYQTIITSASLPFKLPTF